MGHDPPTLAISICRNGNGSKKDSLVNIEANGCVATGYEQGREDNSHPLTQTSKELTLREWFGQLKTLMGSQN